MNSPDWRSFLPQLPWYAQAQKDGLCDDGFSFFDGALEEIIERLSAETGHSCWPLPIRWEPCIDDALLGDRTPPFHERLPRPVQFISRVLIPGGEVAVSLKYISRQDPGFGWQTYVDRDIPLQADVNQRRYSGEIVVRHYTEMLAEYVRVPGEGHDTALRVAMGLTAAMKDWDSRVALYPPSAHCHACGRTLRDPISKALRIGPECAKKHGIGHTWDYVRRIEARRAEILATWRAAL